MKQILFFIILFPFLFASCSKEDDKSDLIKAVFGVEDYLISESEEEVPESPWHLFNGYNRSDSGEYMIIEYWAFVSVTNNEGKDLLSSQEPGSFANGLTVEINGKETRLWSISDKEREPYNLHCIIAKYVPGYPLTFHWPDGSSDTVGVYLEFNRERTKYRICYLVNGEKQYTNYLCLTK
ncbi:MAG: hypothetical protein J6T07_06155 [Bacteroidales bacterium]|nr:hypothetical protein [Bacteroidales bacterium]